MSVERTPAPRGFTLIEVLVALAIVAFGLIAVFGQLSQSATAASRLRDKTLASWVAHNELAELRLSGEYPGVGTRSDDVEMANQRWHYEIKISETEGDFLRRADVTVGFSDRPDRPVATVVGFLAQPDAGPSSVPGPGLASDSGWPPLTGDEQPGEAAPPPPTPTADDPNAEQPPESEPVPPPNEPPETGGAEQ